MKKVFLPLVLSLVFHTAFAEDKKAETVVDPKQEHVEMHEKMAKAHQEAAECLKSGKAEEECRKTFHESCPGMGAMGGSGKCEWGSMHHKQKMGNRKSK